MQPVDKELILFYYFFFFVFFVVNMIYTLCKIHVFNR